MKKLFFAGRKINNLPFELHHVFVMMLAYKKQPNTITALRNTVKLRGISIAYAVGSYGYTGHQSIKFILIEPKHIFNSNKLFSYNVLKQQ